MRVILKCELGINKRCRGYKQKSILSIEKHCRTYSARLIRVYYYLLFVISLQPLTQAENHTFQEQHRTFY